MPRQAGSCLSCQTLGVTKAYTFQMRTSVIVALISLLFGGCNAAVSANPDDYYAPKLLSDEKLLTFVIPVEIDERARKKSFVKLFEL
jgi:hypothetical protein